MSREAIVLLIGGIIFFIMTFIELTFCFIENEKLRKIFKIFPVLILSLTFLIAFPNYPLVYVGSLLGVVGDLILIFEKKQVFFYIGAVSFFIGHVFYLISTIILSGIEYSWYHYLLIVIGYLLLLVVIIVGFRKDFKLIERILVSFYFGIMIFSLINSFVTGIKYGEYNLFLISLGYLCFLISDSLLVKKVFKGEYKRDDFYIMSTYVAAEFFIVLAFVLFVY